MYEKQRRQCRVKKKNVGNTEKQKSRKKIERWQKPKKKRKKSRIKSKIKYRKKKWKKKNLQKATKG